MTPLAILATVLAYFAVLFIVSGLARRNVDNAAFFTGSRQHIGRNLRFGARHGGAKWLWLSATGVGIYRRSAHCSLRTYALVLSFAAYIGLRIPAQPLWAAGLSHGCLVLFHLKDVGCGRSSLSRVFHLAAFGFRSVGHTLLG